MVEVRQGGSSREAATANKLTPRPLFNLTLHLMPGLEKIWGCCSCHLSPLSLFRAGQSVWQAEVGCQDPLQNEGAGHSSRFAPFHKNRDWLNHGDHYVSRGDFPKSNNFEKLPHLLWLETNLHLVLTRIQK